MTIRKRIMLILTGLIVFGFAGPAIIFIAQGYNFDFENNRIVASGTLVVKTEPRGADVKANGRILNNTPLTKRFLQPGEYLIELAKDGYHRWQKRINIFAGEVTFLPTRPEEKIFMFLENPEDLLVLNSVADISVSANAFFYLEETGRRIYRLDFGDLNPVLMASTTMALPKTKFIGISANDQGDGFLLGSNDEVWYVSGSSARSLSKLASPLFGNNPGNVLGINSLNQLVEIAPSVTTVLARDVFAFQKNTNGLFYLSRRSSKEIWLYHSPATGEHRPIIALPPFQNAQIIASSQNNIYLLLDDELYEVTETLGKLRSSVDYATWDESSGLLIYGNEHEIWTYNNLVSPPNRLIIRSTTPITFTGFHKQTGYIFSLEGQTIEAIELDDSGQPNVFPLLESPNTSKFFLNEDGSILALLSGQTLKLIRIR